MMQAYNQAHVVQLPVLKDKCFCPVLALKTLMAKIPRGMNLPVFQINTKQGWVPLSAPRAHSFLRLVITALGLNPSTYTFHTFRRSGVSLLSKIKQHSNWKSEAIWTYLNSTPKVASRSLPPLNNWYLPITKTYLGFGR